MTDIVVVKIVYLRLSEANEDIEVDFFTSLLPGSIHFGLVIESCYFLDSFYWQVSSKYQLFYAFKGRFFDFFKSIKH